MPCYAVDLPGGDVALVRGRLGPHCRQCQRVGEYLCDFEVSFGKTCDQPMCNLHRGQAGPGVDYCDAHYVQWQQLGGTPPSEPSKQGGLF